MVQEYLDMISFHKLTWHAVLVLSAVVFVSYLFAHFILNYAVRKILSRRSKDWQSVLEEQNTFRPLSYVLPLFFLHVGLDHVNIVPPIVLGVLKAGMTWMVALLIRRFIISLQKVYEKNPLAKRHPVTGYVQMILLLLYAVAGVIIICALLNKSPVVFLSSLGAATALLMLVFRDTILSFIAGLQIAGNNLLEKGDWIELPSHGANGSVTDITLNVIKIENFDKSSVVLPTYKLLDVGFKSWRTMQMSGRRRVMANINIDQKTIVELTPTQIKGLLGNKEIAQCLPQDIKETNNMGLFRAYTAGYFSRHPKVYQEYVPIIRLLSATEVGIPLQLIFFIADTRWRHFEEARADIIQHLLARLQDFELQVGQES